MNSALSSPATLILVITALALVPFALITMTSFIKISVVMFLLRNALGIQQTPPNVILYAIALILTFFISGPTIQKSYDNIKDTNPSLSNVQELLAGAQQAGQPFRDYLTKFTTQDERAFFVSATERLWPENSRADVTASDFSILVPSFVISELKRAFEIGFLIYIPFISIDLIVSAILLSLGMSQVPPITLSVPFKLFLFVSLDGWPKLLHGLVLGYS